VVNLEGNVCVTVDSVIPVAVTIGTVRVFSNSKGVVPANPVVGAARVVTDTGGKLTVVDVVGNWVVGVTFGKTMHSPLKSQ
jgi:hypothetical protein